MTPLAHLLALPIRAYRLILSPWVGFNLSMSLYQKIPVQAIFYLKEVRPNFKLYASPMNFDSMNPALQYTIWVQCVKFFYTIIQKDK